MSNTPKLRFKEFSGDWEKKKLGELGEFKNGVNKSKKDFGYGYPFINLMDVFGKNSIENGKFELVNVTDKELKESNLLKGDVLFVRSSVKPSGVGMTSVVLEDLNNTVYSGFLIRFRDNNSLDLYFKKYCFYNKKFRMELISKSSTSANTNINQESLKLLNINVPSIEEQEKIASFFSLIDNKISLQGEKVEALKDYKKGIMQKIFSRELRFKDDNGKDYPEWEERRFKNFVKINQGLQIPISERYTSDGENRYFYITNEFLKSNSRIKYYIETPPKNVICEEDDILMTRTGNTGKVVTGVSGAFHNNFFKIDYDRYKCNKMFLYYILTSHKIQKNIIRLAGTSTIPDLNHSDFYNIKIKLPIKEEQEKIANLLSNIDLKIEKEQYKLNSLNEYKKGLLQQMFV